jgi:hypothetical protein
METVAPEEGSKAANSVKPEQEGTKKEKSWFKRHF